MKYKNYGELNDELNSGLNLELLKNSDNISSRNTNRPIANLNENQEEIYALLNNLIKTVYGKANNSILPGIYEECSPEGIIINSFGNTDNLFLRIPTGSLLLSKPVNSDNDSKKFGDEGYKDNFYNDNLTNDKFGSFVYSNKPNLSLLERQFANLINLDLSELDNDIKINEAELPLYYNVYEFENGFPKADSSGNYKLVYLDDKLLYLCDESKAKYFSEDVFEDNTVVNYGEGDTSFSPYGEGSNTYNLTKYYIDAASDPNIVFKPYERGSINASGKNKILYFTTNKNDSLTYTDFYKENNKKSIGYCFSVTQTTYDNIPVTNYFPNKQENSKWEIKIEGQDTTEVCQYNISLVDEKDKNLKEIKFSIDSTASDIYVNNKIANELAINFNDFFKVEKISSANKSAKDAIRIYNISSAAVANDYKLTITKKVGNLAPAACDNLITNEVISNLKPIALIEQKYYDNIFELINGFISNFISSINVNKKDINKYISLEPLLKLPSTSDTIYYIYYDLNFNVEENKQKENYDHSGRLFITTKDLTNNSFIKLFKLEINIPIDDTNKSIRPKISSITTYLKTLDSRVTNTKTGEFSSLNVNSKSTFNNTTNINGELNINGKTNIDGEFNIGGDIVAEGPLVNIRNSSSSLVENELSGISVNNFDGKNNGVLAFGKNNARTGSYKLYYSAKSEAVPETVYEKYLSNGTLDTPVLSAEISPSLKFVKIIYINSVEVYVWASDDTKLISVMEDDPKDGGMTIWNSEKKYLETGGNTIYMTVNNLKEARKLLPKDNQRWNIVSKEYIIGDEI